MNTLQTGKLIIILGVVVVVIGGVIYLAAKFNFPLGRLPGDIRIERENFTLYFPLTTMILVSLLITLGLNLLNRWLNK